MGSATELQGDDWKERAHNQGQEDAAAGKSRDYPFPIAITEGAKEANDLYEEGFSHTESQNRNK